MEYKIYEGNIEKLNRKIEKIRRKFDKLNATLTYEILREEFEDFGDGDIRKFIIVEAGGLAIINGWKVIGKLEAIDNNENIVNVYDVAYTNVLEKFRTKGIKCEHCNTNARRKYSYILINEETNEVKQIGTACLSNFTGISASKYAAFLSCFDDLVEFEQVENIPNVKKYYKVKTILQIAIQLINKYGYTPKSTYDSINFCEIFHDDATSIAVKEVLTEKKLHHRYSDFRFKENDLETLKQVGEVIKFYNNDEPKNNYEANIKLAMNNEYVDYTKIGILASSIQTKRIKEQEAKRLSELTSIHFGNIGERVQLENCKIEKISSFYTEFGTTYIYKITNNKNTFIWKTGKFLEFQEGINLKGTIKAHNEFRGEKQTELTRVKIA